MLHYMRLMPGPYGLIESGKKDIELRLLDEKRQLIKVGDFIEFENSENSSCTLKTKVKALHIFPSFDDLYASLDLQRCGYVEGELDYASPADMELYYSKDKQEKYGVVGIEIIVM